MNFKAVFKNLGETVKQRSPEILVGVGIVGMVTGTIMAVKATPKALELIKADSREAHDGDPYAYTKKEAVKSAWKCYIPAAAIELVSIGCIVGSSTINAKRNAVLAAAYGISESALKEYREKVIETVGEKKEKTVHDAIAKDRMEKDPVTNKEVVITSKGDTLCYDELSGRYFKSNMETIKSAMNEVNRRLLNEGFVTLNDFYFEIGLPEIGVGDDLGWDVGDGYLDLSFSSQLAADGTPCLVIGHYNPPIYGFKHA